MVQEAQNQGQKHASPWVRVQRKREEQSPFAGRENMGENILPFRSQFATNGSR